MTLIGQRPRRVREDEQHRGYSAAELALLRMPLVPWAIGKCQDCGATICKDPLPHVCNPMKPSGENSMQQMEAIAIGSVMGLSTRGGTNER